MRMEDDARAVSQWYMQHQSTSPKHSSVADCYYAVFAVATFPGSAARSHLYLYVNVLETVSDARYLVDAHANQVLGSSTVIGQAMTAGQCGAAAA